MRALITPERARGAGARCACTATRRARRGARAVRTRRLHREPRRRPSSDVAERLAWSGARVAAARSRASDLQRRCARSPRPAIADDEWTRRRSAIVDEYLEGRRGAEMSASQRADVARLAVAAPDGIARARRRARQGRAVAGGGQARLRVRSPRASPKSIARIAVERATPLLVRAAGLPTDGPDADLHPRAASRTLADDLFVHINPSRHAGAPLTARIAGEPVLDRGFSRSVGDNQVRSLIVAIVVGAAPHVRAVPLAAAGARCRCRRRC